MIGSTSYRLSSEIARQSKLAKDIALAQTQISTQSRLQTPSDDPAASARVANIRRTQASEAAWAANVKTAAAVASQTDTTLGSVSVALDRARELMLLASSDTVSASDRASIASELRGIGKDLASYAAQNDSSGNPLFPATEPNQIPIGHGLSEQATLSQSAAFSVATASGAKTMIAIIADAATAAETGDGAARAASLDQIGAASDLAADARGLQGVRAARIDAAGERLAENKIMLATEKSGLADTDLSETIAQLQAKLLTLDAAQSAFARIHQKTLFDYLG